MFLHLPSQEKDPYSIIFEVEDVHCHTEVTCSNANWGNITKQFISPRLEFRVCPWQHHINDCLTRNNSFSCRVRLVQPVPGGGSSEWSDHLEITIEEGIIENVETTSRGRVVNRAKETDVTMTTTITTMTILTTGKENGVGQNPSSKFEEISSNQQKTSLSPLLLLFLLLQILLLNLFDPSFTP